MPLTQSPSKDAFQRLLDGLQTFIREHLALARAEIKEDVRAMGGDLAIGAAGLPALLTGYLLLMVAIAYGLASWLPLWAAFGIVALLNLGAGAGLSFAAYRKIMARRSGTLNHTGAELQRDKAWLASLPQRTAPAPEAGKPAVQ